MLLIRDGEEDRKSDEGCYASNLRKVGVFEENSEIRVK